MISEDVGRKLITKLYTVIPYLINNIIKEASHWNDIVVP